MNVAYKTYKHSGMYIHQEEYKYHRNQFNKNVRLEKKKHCIERLKKSSNKSKYAWKMADDIVDRDGRKKALSVLNSQINLKLDNNAIITDPNKVANIFNDHFTSLAAQNEASSSNTSNFIEDNNSILNDKECRLESVNTDTIIKIIKKLPNKTSSSHDGVSYNLLKSCLNILIEPLTLLINHTIVEGTFPDCLKHSKWWQFIKRAFVN